MSLRGWAKRLRSPISATRPMAVIAATPRSACSAATTGSKRQPVIESTAPRQALHALVGRLHGLPVLGERRLGRTGAEVQLSPASGSEALHHEVLPLIAHVVAQQEALELLARLGAALTASSRARDRSRIASSAGSGIHTALNCPAREHSARCTLSRPSVLTRSPGRLGICDGAIISQA